MKDRVSYIIPATSNHKEVFFRGGKKGRGKALEISGREHTSGLTIDQLWTFFIKN